MYLNPIQSLPWDQDTQQGDCPSLFCLKFILLYHKELTEKKTDDKSYFYICIIFIYMLLESKINPSRVFNTEN